MRTPQEKPYSPGPALLKHPKLGPPWLFMLGLDASEKQCSFHSPMSSAKNFSFLEQKIISNLNVHSENFWIKPSSQSLSWLRKAGVKTFKASMICVSHTLHPINQEILCPECGCLFFNTIFATTFSAPFITYFSVSSFLLLSIFSTDTKANHLNINFTKLLPCSGSSNVSQVLLKSIFLTMVCKTLYVLKSVPV